METEDYAVDFLDANRIRAKILNTGGLFWDDGTPEYAYAGNNTIFVANLAVGGLIEDKLHVAASTYGPWEFWPGPVDSVRAGVDCRQMNRMYRVAREDYSRLDDGQPPTADLRDWPWRSGAPVTDGDGNPNNYDLDAGDRPAILGDEMIYWVMNDVAGPHDRTNTGPLGLEVHAIAFAAPSTDPAIHNSTFYRYRIINRGDAPIDSAFVGMIVDIDVGAAYDDAVGTDSLLNLVYGYNLDDVDDGNYGTYPPATGLQIYHSPVGLPDGYDNDRDGEVDEEGERLGLSYGMWYSGSGGIQGDPLNGGDIYGYMSGRWKDGQPATFGGDGRGFSTRPVRYVFPAEPGQFWSELNTDGNGTIHAGGDRRFVASAGPFRLKPGEETGFFFGFLTARGTDHLDSVRELKAYATRLADLRPEDVVGETVPLRGPAVRLVSPGDGATDVPLDVPFIWADAVTDARYHLELTNLDSGTTDTLEFEGRDGDGVTLRLDPATRYSWRVREFTTNIEGVWTEPVMFSTGSLRYLTIRPFVDFLVTQNAAGELDPPEGAASPGFEGYRGISGNDNQQVGPAVWLIHSYPAPQYEDFEGFVDQVLPPDASRTLQSDYEIRFAGESAALDADGRASGVTVPFEVWDIGNDTPADPSDDVRLIPRVHDADGDGWNLRLIDHPGSSREDDPFTDPVTFLDPMDLSPGQAGYKAFADAAEAGSDVSSLAGAEVLSDLVFMGWNLGLDPDEIEQSHPEPGTIFRIVTGDVPAPALAAPGQGQCLQTGSVDFHWLETVADRATIEVARSADFSDVVVREGGVAPGHSVDLTMAGTYYWRILGATGASPTWSFMIVDGACPANEPVAPDDPEIGQPYPNPATESVTLPVAGDVSGPLTVELFDVLGRRAAHFNVDRPAGGIRFGIGGLASGVYVVRVRAADRTWTHRFIVSH